MNEQLDRQNQQRIQALYRYTSAMEHGDNDTIIAIMQEAEHDSVLEHMILEVNEVYQIEDSTVVHQDDVVLAQEMLQHILAGPGVEKHAEVVSVSANVAGRSDKEVGPVTLHPLVARKLATRKWYRTRKSWVAALVAAALLALLLVPSASVLASQFLALFRVQQLQAVTVNPDQLRGEFLNYVQNFADNRGPIDTSSGGILPSSHSAATQAGSQGPTDTGSGSAIASSRSDLTQAEVEQLIQFHLQLPSHLPEGVGNVKQFTISPGETDTLVFDTARARAYLQKTGQGDVAIPAQLNGATFTVKLAAGVEISYYTSCQTRAAGVRQCSGGTLFSIFEIPSPVVQSAQLKDLRDFMLSLPKLSSDMRGMLQAINLSNGTIPVPVPIGVSSQHVSIEGNSALQLSDGNMAVVMWQKQDVLYVIGADGASISQVVDAANTLR